MRRHRRTFARRGAARQLEVAVGVAARRGCRRLHLRLLGLYCGRGEQRDTRYERAIVVARERDFSKRVAAARTAHLRRAAGSCACCDMTRGE